jgi:oxygen-independent coproporphyrinogen-3 oxidase
MVKSVYIHIPFCKSKCHYCSFVSYIDLTCKNQYIKALLAQIKQEYKGENLKTLYFGGGTPSLLTIKEFQSLIGLFNLAENPEITVEVNPESVNFEFLQGLKNIGINRLSIGVQTFDDGILNLIGRRHNSQQALIALNCAKEAGFKNISLDLIYGLPTQKLKDFEKDIKIVIDLNVQHISLYGLKIEDGCYFYKNKPDFLPDSDLQAQMYLKSEKVLKEYGFEHYEVSNFSLPDFQSKHNLNYWDNNNYYGFGCSASGYTDKIRYTNENNLKKYIKNPLLKTDKHELSTSEILEEEIFLGFRKLEGININEINVKFGIDFEKKYAKILDRYSKFFIKTSTGYTLTTEGILISNEILAEFID